MNQKVFTLSVMASLVLGSQVVMAASPMALKSNSMPILQKQFINSTSLNSQMQINSLRVLSNHKDFNNTYHQRMQQMYQGVEVVGGNAVIHSKQANGFAASKATVNGTVYHNLESDLGAKPQNKAELALNSLISNYKQSKISEKTSTLVVYIDNKNQAHWAYKVSFLAQDGKSIPKRPSSFIDAKTMQPLLSWDDIKTLKHPAFGIGYGGNKRTGKYSYDGAADSYALLEISRNDEKSKCFMETELVKVVDMEGDYSSNNRAMKFDCEEEYAENTFYTGNDGDGFDKKNGAYSPSNDALYLGYVINNMYKQWYNADALQHRDGSPMQVVMRVHYGSKYQNAFWDGKQMTYGDGGSMMYPLVSMGVGAHEISHGFTQQHSDLAYYGQSGGMNESFSDMAAMGAIFYSFNESKEPSFKIGDRIMKKDSGYDALRYMDKPSKDGRSIDSATDYRSGLDVHYSSGVFNRMFYLIATSEGWNTRKAFDVMVKANSDYWTSNEKFQSGACGVISATQDYKYPVADVEAAAKKVGLDPEECYS